MKEIIVAAVLVAGNPASTLALTNYGFSVKAEMSTMRGKSEFPVLDNGDIRYDSGWEGGLVGLVP